MDNTGSNTQDKQTPDIEAITISNENEALNAMVLFLNMAQKRGTFNLQESAKVWECIKIFMKK